MNVPKLSLSAALSRVRFAHFLILLGLLSTPSSAEEGKAAPPVPQQTIEIPSYDFDYEETKPTLWRLGNRQLSRYSLAYLILDPKNAGRERRAVVLVDSIEKPTNAFFLTDSKLVRVPEVKGQPLAGRIDRKMSQLAELLIATRPLTVDFAGGAGKDVRVDLRFAPALKGFYEKFDDAPCLTLPDVAALSRAGRTVAFAILIKNEGPNPDFDRRCGKVDGNLVPQQFSYVIGVRLRFAPTRTRIVMHYRNYVFSIPYGLDDDAINRAAFLVQEAQLQNILGEFKDFPKSGDTRPELADEEARRQALAVQKPIDEALLAVLRKKGTTW
jgi:hypothetical protein